MNHKMTCPICKTGGHDMQANYCRKCGANLKALRENYCQNPDCTRHKAQHRFAVDDYYCDLCGENTSLGDIMKTFV